MGRVNRCSSRFSAETAQFQNQRQRVLMLFIYINGLRIRACGTQWLQFVYMCDLDEAFLAMNANCQSVSALRCVYQFRVCSGDAMRVVCAYILGNINMVKCDCEGLLHRECISRKIAESCNQILTLIKMNRQLHSDIFNETTVVMYFFYEIFIF